MKSIHLISVGKNKEKNYLSLEEDYLKRIKTFQLTLHEVKAHEENLELEAQEVLKKLNSINKGKAIPFFLLAEKGKHFDSNQFSDYLAKNLEQHSAFALIIGGASGHGEELYAQASGLLSLSKLTLPHKMARLVLIEQLYRAETISLGHPYNK